MNEQKRLEEQMRENVQRAERERLHKMGKSPKDSKRDGLFWWCVMGVICFFTFSILDV